KRNRIDAEQRREIVVANVLEVPPCRVIARNSRLPSWVVMRRLAVRQQGIDRLLIGHVGEAETLGGKPHVAAPRILERTQIRAHAVVVRYACVGVKWKRRARGRRRRVWNPWRESLTETRQDFVEQRSRPRRAIEPEHRRLLFDLAASAEHRERRMQAKAS